MPETSIAGGQGARSTIAAAGRPQEVITEGIREDVPAGAPRPGRWRRWWPAFAAVVLLAGMAVAMITTAVEQTPTIDEPVYIGTAVYSLEHHSLRFNPEHPPLGKLIIATGLAFADVHVDAGFAGDQAQLGRSVLYESGHDPGRLLLLARLPVIVLTLLFGLVVFAFARDLAGPAGGVVALALYALSPDIVAHGSLATLDVPVAGFLVTSAWLLWRARRRPGRYLPLAALALGAAVATKMSALAAVPVVLLLVVLSVRQARASGPQRTLRRLGAGAAAVLGVALIAVAVVWVSYLVVDPRLRWVPPPGLPPAEGLRSLAGLLPLPGPYVDGMRVQFGFEDQVWTTFLFGSRHVGALWYYLPAALLVKTPLGTLALWAAGVVTTVAVPRLRPAAPYVLLPAAVLWPRP
ncbi:phospholipid carrier-dependent glycosyltransferase [Amycolatopsis mediterranei]|uniref:ArnT family glycosyltransferase n=1 Tax=Amycolatopsis mediterranei TaxID=33910 RepID=UPI00341B838F